MEWIMGALSFVCGIGFGLLAMPVIAPSAARRQVKKINPDLLPTKVVCPLPPLPAMPPPPPLISEYAPRPTRAAGVRKSPSTEKLMAVWWQAKIDSVARAPLHQTAADDALQPRPPTGNAAVPRSTRDLLPSIKWGSEVNSRTENVAHGYQGEGPHNELLQQEAAALSVSHQPRQLGDAGGDAPGLVSGEELRRRAASRLLLGIDVGQRLPVVIADDEAGVGLLGGPRRREAADGHRVRAIIACCRLRRRLLCVGLREYHVGSVDIRFGRCRREHSVD
jgi:hypothetical protein